MNNKNLKPYELLNKVVREASYLSDQTFAPMPHFWHSDSGRFYCSVRIVIKNAEDEQTMEDLMRTFPEPDEVRTDVLEMMTFEYRVFGKYPDAQAEVILVKSNR